MQVCALFKAQNYLAAVLGVQLEVTQALGLLGHKKGVPLNVSDRHHVSQTPPDTTSSGGCLWYMATASLGTGCCGVVWMHKSYCRYERSRRRSKLQVHKMGIPSCLRKLTVLQKTRTRG